MSSFDDMIDAATGALPTWALLELTVGIFGDAVMERYMEQENKEARGEFLRAMWRVWGWEKNVTMQSNLVSTMVEKRQQAEAFEQEVRLQSPNISITTLREGLLMKREAELLHIVVDAFSFCKEDDGTETITINMTETPGMQVTVRGGTGNSFQINGHDVHGEVSSLFNLLARSRQFQIALYIYYRFFEPSEFVYVFSL